MTNIADPSIEFPSAWLDELFGRRFEGFEGFEGFSEAELAEISRLSETHMLREAVRLVLLARRET